MATTCFDFFTTKFPFRRSAYRLGWHSFTFSVTQVDWYPSGIVGMVQSENITILVKTLHRTGVQRSSPAGKPFELCHCSSITLVALTKVEYQVLVLSLLWRNSTLTLLIDELAPFVHLHTISMLQWAADINYGILDQLFVGEQKRISLLREQYLDMRVDTSMHSFFFP